MSHSRCCATVVQNDSARQIHSQTWEHCSKAVHSWDPPTRLRGTVPAFKPYWYPSLQAVEGGFTQAQSGGVGEAREKNNSQLVSCRDAVLWHPGLGARAALYRPRAGQTLTNARWCLSRRPIWL